ncbi:MAG TPA: selenium metabolism-associated LysR family transcriptional regulator [Spirochaetia bacterium]|nr:selenium metabolism-associated LysR family transcriptional regulator [Spirochaetia bacterium]
MQLKQLEAFLRVAELKSFTKAAQQLYMSQPAISFQIKSLEEDLQVSLFQRRDKKVLLTEAGQLLYPEARQIVKHFQRVKGALEELRGLKTGKLTVGGSTVPGEYILPAMVGLFKVSYPGITVSLKIGDSREVAARVREWDIDLGVTGAPVEIAGLSCTRWLADRMMVVAAPGRKFRRELDLAGMVAEPLVLREPGSGTRQVLAQRLAEAGLSLEECPQAMEMGSTRAVISAVEAGLGLAVVSVWAAAEPLALGRLEEVVVAGLNLERHFYLVRHEAGLGSFALDAFYDFLQGQKAEPGAVGPAAASSGTPERP